jgi:hypothetical protein
MKIKGKGIILIALLVIALIGLAITSYYLYFYLRQCGSEECFSNSLVRCDKMSFIRDDGNNIIQYKILGKEGDSCKVNVNLLQVKKGTSELTVLEGKDMTCLLPLGVLTDPAKNLKDCQGILKEEIQSIIIQRMHAQIVENLGKISEETTKVL